MPGIQMGPCSHQVSVFAVNDVDIWIQLHTRVSSLVLGEWMDFKIEGSPLSIEIIPKKIWLVHIISLYPDSKVSYRRMEGSKCPLKKVFNCIILFLEETQFDDFGGDRVSASTH